MANYLYNNIELPEIPASASPVAVISSVLESASSMFGGASYIVTFGASILWSGGKCYVSNISGVYRYDGSAWVWHYGSGTTYTQDIIASGYFDAVWTNTNIPTADGVNVYLAATDPVPVGGDSGGGSGGEEETPETPEYTIDDVIKARREGFITGLLTGLNIKGVLHKKTITFIPKDCLTFTSDEVFTLASSGGKQWDGTVYYSTNLSDWNEWDGKAIASANVKGKQQLYVRGSNNTKLTANNANNQSSTNKYRWQLTGSDIQCNGNIEVLFDWETVANGEHPVMADWACAYMFKDNTALVSAPELSATTMMAYCYHGMFYGCKELTTPPELPATTLANYCYYAMFMGCYKLSSAPKLPAATMAEGCYYQMFYGCIALASPPELPSRTLAANCYRAMFMECPGLTSLPSLIATNLPSYCYASMFARCTNIKVSATKTDVCPNEYRVPATGTGIAGNYVCMSMFADTGGSFTGTPSINTTYYTSNEVV